jgi:RNA polymerase sigma factor (sigma-70 family)
VIEPSDEVLLLGLAAGDERAAQLFVQRYSPRAIGLAYQFLGDRAAAEDVAQEAFVRVWRFAASFDARRASVTTWFMTIVRNLSIDALRLRRAEPFDPAALPLARWAEPHSAADDEAQARADASLVRSSLRSVPVDQRRSLLLAYSGFTAVEIADVEQIPVGTAKTRIRSGLHRLRRTYLADPRSVAGVDAAPSRSSDDVEGLP